MPKNFFAPHREEKGAYRSGHIFARCQHCEEPAGAYCGRCGHTFCDTHAPADELCRECHQHFNTELNRKQGRFWEGIGMVLLSLALIGAGLGAAGAALRLDALWAKALGGLLFFVFALAPIWVVLGRGWIARKLYRRIR